MRIVFPKCVLRSCAFSLKSKPSPVTNKSSPSGVQASREEAGTLEDADWWAGEPSLSISTADPEKLFASVLADLNNVNKLQVLDLEWLSQGEFRVRVETLLLAFKAAGGEVVYKGLEN